MNLKEEILAELSDKRFDAGRWPKLATLIKTYHFANWASNPNWNFADTARELSVSRAYVSECIGLCKLMVSDPEIIHLSRIAALRKMRDSRADSR